MFNRPLISFLPHVYEGIVEMQELMNAEENVVDIARAELYSTFSNTFVLTSDLSGVIMFERMLNITADPQTQTLEFRKQKILNRMSTRPPFTFAFLQQKLDEIIGKNAWSAYVDFANYTLYIESSAVDQNWYSEVAFTVESVKPCNMVFVNVPLTADGVLLSEEVSYTAQNWRYRLGSWKLGAYPFATQDGGGVIKMANVKSINPSLLRNTANFVYSDIASVLINDTIEISEFRVKEVSDNVVTLEYTVTPEMTNLISDIKLRSADGSVLTQSTVYVPVTQSVISKHTITVKEGT